MHDPLALRCPDPCRTRHASESRCTELWCPPGKALYHLRLEAIYGNVLWYKTSDGTHLILTSNESQGCPLQTTDSNVGITIPTVNMPRQCAMIPIGFNGFMDGGPCQLAGHLGPARWPYYSYPCWPTAPADWSRRYCDCRCCARNAPEPRPPREHGKHKHRHKHEHEHHHRHREKGTQRDGHRDGFRVQFSPQVLINGQASPFVQLDPSTYIPWKEEKKPSDGKVKTRKSVYSPPSYYSPTPSFGSAKRAHNSNTSDNGSNSDPSYGGPGMGASNFYNYQTLQWPGQ